MPIYTFENTKTGERYDDMMSIAEKEEFLEKNKHIKQCLTTINISSGVQGISMKTDGGWKDNLSRIADAHPTYELNKHTTNISKTSLEIALKQIL